MEDKIKNPEIQSSQQHFGTNLSLESIKIIAESIGIGECNLKDESQTFNHNILNCRQFIRLSS